MVNAGAVAPSRRRALAHRDARAVVHADKVLLATNGFTDDLWPALAAPSCRCSPRSSATAPLSDEVARSIMPTRPVLYESGPHQRSTTASIKNNAS
jgi:glycine/D-amino acid oxidase-like deaminating enzyme